MVKLNGLEINADDEQNHVTMRGIGLTQAARDEIARHTEEFIARGGEITTLANVSRTHVRTDEYKRMNETREKLNSRSAAQARK